MTMSVHLMTARGEILHEAGTVGRTDGGIPALVRYWLTSGFLLVGHNIAYDLACLCAEDPELVPLVFQAYRENRITDTMLRQKLADIGEGKYRGFFNGPAYIPLKYDLGSVASRYKYKVDKEDPWRLRYGELIDVPLVEWPEGAIVYAIKDVHATGAAFLGQCARYGEVPDPKVPIVFFDCETFTFQSGRMAPRVVCIQFAVETEIVPWVESAAPLLIDQFAQARKYWALHLASAWGLRTSLRGVLSLEKGAREKLFDLECQLKAPSDGSAPLVKADGVRDTKAAKARMIAACAELKIEPRRTKSGDICLDSDACKGVGDPLLEAYAELSSYKKVLTNDVEALRRGVVVPISTHFDLAETGRTTSARPNIQNPRRLPGVRECFVPRGYVE